ncbi:MAG: hypothetical protein A2007_06285 [Verrucomicrobia bacterium GWC2_42_7]|nr:MAG: hypothetical protein A2007_06285 [Verrucomicrobia bacterium GWC2_42_7]
MKNKTVIIIAISALILGFILGINLGGNASRNSCGKSIGDMTGAEFAERLEHDRKAMMKGVENFKLPEHY